MNSEHRWPWIRARHRFREVAEKGFDLPLASVTKDGGVEFRSDLEISVWNPGDDVSGYKRVLLDDFVIGLRSFQSGIGHSSISGLVSPAYTVLRAVHPVVPGFFRHYFKSKVFISQLESVAQGIRQGRTINTADFYDLRLPEPPLAEQRAIADFLDRETARIDALIAAKRRMVELLEVRRLGVISEAIESATPHSGGDARRLKHVCRVERGRFTHRPRSDPDMYGGEAPFVQTGDIRSAEKHIRSFSQTLSIQGRSASRSFATGTVLMAIAANVGDVAITTFETWCPDSVVGFLPSPKVDAEYLYYLLLSQRRKINETSTESTQENTNIALLGELPASVPDVEDQRSIAARLAYLDDQTALGRSVLGRQLDLLVEHRQALITAAVTGELEVAA